MTAATRDVDARSLTVRLKEAARELGAAVAFMDVLPRAHVIEKLRQQRRNSVAVRAELLAMIPDFPGRYEAPHATDLLELWSGVFDNLSTWTDGILARLEAGGYHMTD